MASKTTNYNLDMPGYSDIADIDVINGNMDKIDVQMKKNADSAQQSKDIVSDEYSATKTYAVGDYCIHENILYKCKTAITTGEAFDSNKWVQTTCGTEFRELKGDLDDLENDCLTLQNAPIKVGVYLGNTGEFKLSGDYRCSSEYHEITPNMPIKLELNTENDDWGLLFYDENKTYLGRDNSVFVKSGKLIETTTPANAKYVTFIIHIYNGNFPIPKLYTTKIGNVVSNLNESLEGQGLFKKSNIKINSGISYETGETYPSDKTFSTDYINVSGYTKITCNKYSFANGNLWGAFYDSSKNYISGFMQNSKTITVLNNAKYIRLTFMNEDIDDVYICAGVIGDVAEEVNGLKNDLGGLSFSASGTTLSITNGTNTWTLEAN